MQESRTSNVKKNILWANIGNMILSIFSFVCRTVFIYGLGAKYLGITGLFTNVLGILSFSELGIGTAINYSLYKPIAENDTEKIKSIMRLYKSAYRVIAVIVAILGIVLVPFLKYLVNTDIPISEIRIFYLIFLFNTVSSYFVSYKTSFVSALQKNYIISNINTIGQITVYLFQMIGILVFPSYILYLVVQSVVGTLQKIVTVIYINRKYSILTEKDVKPVDEETKKDIINNVKALIIHKIGEVSVHQTDNIIISVLVNTTTVGLVSNYIILYNMVNKFTDSIFSSFTASFGNLIVKDSKEKQEEIFNIYDFIGYWIYGFVFIAFITLSQPFIELWIGKEMLIDDFTMILYFLTIYLMGQSVTIYNFKVAAGKFNEDKWLAFFQAIVNLFVSIIAVKIIGLPGVYVGTLAQRMIVIVVRPYIVYKHVFDKSPIKYYIRFAFRLLLLFIISTIMYTITNLFFEKVTIISFISLTIITAIIPNLIFLVAFGRTKEFKGVLAKIKK